MLVEKKVMVSKEASELMDGLVGIIAAVKQALDDGWDPAQDLPALAVAAVSKLPPALEGIGQLDDEARAHLGEFVAAFSVGATEIAQMLLPEPAAEEEEPAGPVA